MELVIMYTTIDTETDQITATVWPWAPHRDISWQLVIRSENKERYSFLKVTAVRRTLPPANLIIITREGWEWFYFWEEKFYYACGLTPTKSKECTVVYRSTEQNWLSALTLRYSFNVPSFSCVIKNSYGTFLSHSQLSQHESPWSSRLIFWLRSNPKPK